MLNNVLIDVDMGLIFDTMFNGDENDPTLSSVNLFTLFGKNKDMIREQEDFAVKNSGFETFTPHTENGDVNVFSESSTVKGTIATSLFSGGCQFSFEAIRKAQARGRKGMTDLVALEMGYYANAKADKMNTYFAGNWSDGSGKIAQVAGAVSASVTVVLDNPGIKGNLRIGQKVNFYLGSTLEDTGVIADIRSETNTIKLAAAVTVTDNAFMYMDSTYNAMFDGLDSITGTTTFQSIDPTADGNSFWKTITKDGGAAAISFEMLDDLVDQIRVQGSGSTEPVDFLLFDRETKQKLKNLTESGRTWQNVVTIKGGVRLNSQIALEDRDVPYAINRFWTTPKTMALCTNSIKLYEFVPHTWYKDASDKILRTREQRFDVYATWYQWFNYGCKRRDCNGVLTNYTT